MTYNIFTFFKFRYLFWKYFRYFL